jgi:hypothetical protein
MGIPGDGDQRFRTITYWNIKGLGHFVVSFWLNCLCFLRFGWYHFEQTVVPSRYHS